MAASDGRWSPVLKPCSTMSSTMSRATVSDVFNGRRAQSPVVIGSRVCASSALSRDPFPRVRARCFSDLEADTPPRIQAQIGLTGDRSAHDAGQSHHGLDAFGLRIVMI